MPFYFYQFYFSFPFVTENVRVAHPHTYGIRQTSHIYVRERKDESFENAILPLNKLKTTKEKKKQKKIIGKFIRIRTVEKTPKNKIDVFKLRFRKKKKWKKKFHMWMCLPLSEFLLCAPISPSHTYIFDADRKKN